MSGRMYLEDWITPEGIADDNACVFVVTARVQGS
jgi:hypothetical protein